VVADGFGLVPVGVGFGLVLVGVGTGLVRVGVGTGLVRVGVGVGCVRVGVGMGLVYVGVGVGRVRVGVGMGLVRVGVGMGLVRVGVGIGLVWVGVGAMVVGVVVGVVVDVGEVAVGAGVGGGVQKGAMIVSWSRVTAPLRASARPAMVSPVSTVMDCRARMVPWKMECVPSVAELPTCQKTWQASAPLVSRMWLAESVTSVEPIWKMKTAFGSPPASRVSAPPTSSEVEALYTPGDRVWPAPMKLPTVAVRARPAASLYAVVRSA
jgi:hypothetical protein